MTKTKIVRYVQFEFPYDDFVVKDNQTNEELWNPRIIDRLNEQDERIKELETKQNKVLTDYFNLYTQMAVELRGDKYSNNVCHNIIEVIMEIADKLDMKIGMVDVE